MANEQAISDRPPRGWKPGPEAAPAEPSPYGDAGPAYLLAKGWKCLGPVQWPSTLWIDPLGKPYEQVREEPIMVKQLQRQVTRGPDGKQKDEFVEVDVHLTVHDGSGTGRMTPAFRKIVTPRTDPMPLVQALMVQIERDTEAAVKQAKAEAAAAAEAAKGA